MKKVIALIIIAVLTLTVFGCSSADKAEDILSEAYLQEDTQSVEVSYAEATEDFSVANNETNLVVSSSEEARIADLLLYLAAYQTTPDETAVEYVTDDKNMLGFAWALIADGKYDAVKPVSTDEPNVYLREDINDKILSTVFNNTLSADSGVSGEIEGWEIIDSNNYSFIERKSINGNSVTLGDISITSAEENDDGSLTVNATVANGFWQSSKSPLLKISAQLEASGNSPFGFRVLSASLRCTAGIDTAIETVETSSQFLQGSEILVPENLFDGLVNTVWAEAASGNGIKEYIRMYPDYTDDLATISAIGILNGNLSDYHSVISETEIDEAESITSSSFLRNGRARRIRLTMSNGLSRSYEIPDYDTPTLRPFIILLDDPVRADWIKLSIEASNTASEEMDLDVYLSEIYLYR